MGIVLDTSVLIAYERGRLSVAKLLDDMTVLHPWEEISISVMTIEELTHGVYRSPGPDFSNRRQTFIDRLALAVRLQPPTLSLARLVGQIDGEQAALGVFIDLSDLIIGATALQLGDSVLTHNTKRFNSIPGLTVLTI